MLDFRGFVWYVIHMIKLTEREKILLVFVLPLKEKKMKKVLDKQVKV